MRFFTSGFFHELTSFGPLIHTLKNIFEICFEFMEIFVFEGKKGKNS
jgi:hypothetical protein